MFLPGDELLSTLHLGSGGGVDRPNHIAGKGGGAVKVEAYQIKLNGMINVNGGNGTCCGSGSGGSIHIIAKSFQMANDARLSAIGGHSDHHVHGVGRIRVESEIVTAGFELSNDLERVNPKPYVDAKTVYRKGPPSYEIVAPDPSPIVKDQHYFSWNGPTAPSKGNRIGTVTIDHNFAVHITFTVDGNIIKDKSGDLLHIGPYNDLHNRTPGLHLVHGKLALRISRYGERHWGLNVGAYLDYKCQMGQTYEVVILCKDGIGSMRVNGQSVWYNSNFHPKTQRNVGVWLCSGDSPANVTVRDLLVYRP